MCYNNCGGNGNWGEYWWIILIFAIILIWCCQGNGNGYQCGCGCEEQHCC